MDTSRTGDNIRRGIARKFDMLIRGYLVILCGRLFEHEVVSFQGVNNSV
jgi:hypothetical protein